jgi:hypothetical protein
METKAKSVFRKTHFCPFFKQMYFLRSRDIPLR